MFKWVVGGFVFAVGVSVAFVVGVLVGGVIIVSSQENAT